MKNLKKIVIFVNLLIFTSGISSAMDNKEAKEEVKAPAGPAFTWAGAPGIGFLIGTVVSSAMTASTGVPTGGAGVHAQTHGTHCNHHKDACSDQNCKVMRSLLKQIKSLTTEIAEWVIKPKKTPGDVARVDKKITRLNAQKDKKIKLFLAHKTRIGSFRFDDTDGALVKALGKLEL